MRFLHRLALRGKAVASGNVIDGLLPGERTLYASGNDIVDVNRLQAVGDPDGPLLKHALIGVTRIDERCHTSKFVVKN